MNEIHLYVHKSTDLILTVRYFNHMDFGSIYETCHLFQVHICKHKSIK